MVSGEAEGTESGQKAILKTKFRITMFVCHGGKLIGMINPSGSDFIGQIVRNPLNGSTADSDTRWLVVAPSVLGNGLLDSIKAVFPKLRDGVVSIEEVQVGMPESHIESPDILYRC